MRSPLLRRSGRCASVLRRQRQLNLVTHQGHIASRAPLTLTLTGSSTQGLYNAACVPSWQCILVHTEAARAAPDMRSSCVCDAPESLQWAHHAFHSCINSRAAAASLACGLVSLAVSFAVQLPQVVRNARHKSAIVLSPYFLVCTRARCAGAARVSRTRGAVAQLGWLVGDTANVAGTLLSRQLATQVANAFFFLLMDTVLLLQYLGYEVLPRRARRRAARVATLASCVVVGTSTASPPPLPGAAPRCSNRISIPWHAGTREKVGYALGWLCAACALGALCAQFCRNRRQRSAHGLSATMMSLLALMNVTYAASVLLRVRTAEEFGAAAPWGVGTAAAALMDVVLFLQCRWYCAPKRVEHAVPTLELADGAAGAQYAHA